MEYVAILVPAAIVILIGFVALWRGEQERIEEANDTSDR